MAEFLTHLYLCHIQIELQTNTDSESVVKCFVSAKYNKNIFRSTFSYFMFEIWANEVFFYEVFITDIHHFILFLIQKYVLKWHLTKIHRDSTKTLLFFRQGSIIFFARIWYLFELICIQRKIPRRGRNASFFYCNIIFVFCC